LIGYSTTQVVFIDGKLNHLAFVFRRRKIRSRGNMKSRYDQGFEKLTGADADKFTLVGNKLTFIAKAFKARSDNTYRVKIKATVDVTIF
jgi:hypothetical protein